MNPPLLVAKGIQKRYGEVEILKGVDLEIQRKEIVSIVGASGAGKSTLLHILGTLDRPDQGEVSIEGDSIFLMKDQKLAAFRNTHIGFVFQFHNLLPEFTAFENICIPGMIAKHNENELHERAMQLMRLLGIEQRKDHKPSEMSGGEQQRTAVARALINNPSLIMADEPSGNLDSNNAKQLHELFFQLRDQMGQTFVIVTHNPELATMADRSLEMTDGKLS